MEVKPQLKNHQHLERAALQQLRLWKQHMSDKAAPPRCFSKRTHMALTYLRGVEPPPKTYIQDLCETYFLVSLKLY